MNVGARIREHRDAAGLRQDQLADLCRVSRQTVSNWERNKTLPDIVSLKLMASEFGTTVDALIGDDVPEISRRADAEARHFLALYLASLAIFCLTTVMNLPSQFGGRAFTEPIWDYLRAVLLGAGLAITVPLWRLQKRHHIIYYGELGRYLEKSLALEESRTSTVAHWALRHLPICNGALILLALLAALAINDMLTPPTALLVTAAAAVFIALGVALDRRRQELPGGVPLPPQR